MPRPYVDCRWIRVLSPALSRWELCPENPEEEEFRGDGVPGACPERSRRDGGLGVSPIAKNAPFLPGRGLGGW